MRQKSEPAFPTIVAYRDDDATIRRVVALGQRLGQSRGATLRMLIRTALATFESAAEARP